MVRDQLAGGADRQALVLAKGVERLARGDAVDRRVADTEFLGKTDVACPLEAGVDLARG